MIFTLKFTDNTQFQGQSFNHDWTKAPEKIIKEMVFTFNQSRVILQGYKSYNHKYERASALGKGNFISCLFLMGRREAFTDVILFDFLGKKGYQLETRIGYEFPVKILDKKGKFIKWQFDNRMITGWKNGKLKHPHCAINRLDE